MAHRVLTNLTEYDPFDNFRQLVWQIRFRLNAATFELVEEYLGSFVEYVLMPTLNQWQDALVAQAQRMAIEYEEMREVYEALGGSSSSDEGDGDFDPNFDPTDFGR